ncbi:hypothetical protein PJ267_13670 [Arthrobacter sp. OVS8]|nr:hypothetical protein PJ267_13670 [Arthrobacter sp. OVS8]
MHVLNYPKNHEAWFDIVMNELDGDWYEERNPITLAPNIDIPVWLQLDQGRGWTLDGTIELFNELKGPKSSTSARTRRCSPAPSSRSTTRCSGGTTSGSRASTTASWTSLPSASSWRAPARW